MYLNNDVQQWWYFLISAFAIPSMGSIFHQTFCIWGHLNEDNWSLWYSIIEFCFSVYWSWSLNDDDLWRLYYLRSAIAVPCTVSTFLLTLCNWYFMKDDNEQMRRHLRFVMSVLSTGGPFLSAFLGWRYINEALSKLCSLSSSPWMQWILSTVFVNQ